MIFFHSHLDPHYAIHFISSQFLWLYGSLQAKKYLQPCTTCVDSDHSAHGHSYIQAFALHPYILSYQMILVPDREDPDQTAQMCRLIWAFAVCICWRTFLHGKAHMCITEMFYWQGRGPHVDWTHVCNSELHHNYPLTLVLLNPDIPCLCKQCRSRSVGFWRRQLIWICTVCHSVCEFISTTWIK